MRGGTTTLSLSDDAQGQIDSYPQLNKYQTMSSEGGYPVQSNLSIENYRDDSKTNHFKQTKHQSLQGTSYTIP